MSKTIEDLRKHLFATLEGLQDKENPLDIDRAKAVSEVAQVIINSAKVEVDFAKATGASIGGGFLTPNEVATPGTLPNGIIGIRQHRIKG